ncbi:MAG: glycosyltransferase family 1 protein [Verrucomicrobia bacterium]|nr:MAG: glycosyltransferase family 1 protein [Verrucomicrobiota bacterium]TAF25854.1 MAG: glycosyltransferase family 1 protein [Verrucomicrobiota bacterium]
MTDSNLIGDREAAARRLRILLSAYACEPCKGSEPGTGWNLALALSKSFEVTVVTRTNNRASIEAGLSSESGPRPQFIYHDLPSIFRRLKKMGLLSTQVYYALWQRALGKDLPHQLELRNFDIFHHITFNSFEVAPGLLARFAGVKIWGPIGGGQSLPPALAATLGLKSRIKERLRTLRIRLSRWNPRLVRQLESCDRVLFANDETRDLFETAAVKSSGQMIDVGVDPARFAPTLDSRPGHRIFSAGNFEPRKGSRLLLLAFQKAHELNPTLRLRLAGDGPELPRERAWVASEGLQDVVSFAGRRTHAQMAEEFAMADIFVFPSIRDTSGAIVLEAMACALPVVCLDHQGARLMVGDDAGIRVKTDSLKTAVEGLAAAVLTLSSDAALRELLGRQARERVMTEFTWKNKAERLGQEYRRLAHLASTR